MKIRINSHFLIISLCAAAAFSFGACTSAAPETKAAAEAAPEENLELSFEVKYLLDSNLDDVYLCALLEYLMAYGHGQLCFTTHNIGPMDILKKNKKSIDFLSVDHKIYSWKTSGNYSPSKLYRQGMIEGSPLNVDAIDFIGAFGADDQSVLQFE